MATTPGIMLVVLGTNLNETCKGSDEYFKVHPEDFDRFRGVWQTLKETVAPVNIEYRLKAPWQSVDAATGQELNGERWLAANAFPEVDPDGKMVAVMGWVSLDL